MASDCLMHIRVTGIFVDTGKILLVKQSVGNRNWSLTGGRVQEGESLEKAVIREIEEETGLITEVIKLLYLCEIPSNNPPMLHISFLLRKITGNIRLPTNEHDENIILDVKMIPVRELSNYGFSKKFMKIVEDGFPDAGTYKGLKRNIGL